MSDVSPSYQAFAGTLGFLLILMISVVVMVTLLKIHKGRLLQYVSHSDQKYHRFKYTLLCVFDTQVHESLLYKTLGLQDDPLVI